MGFGSKEIDKDLIMPISKDQRHGDDAGLLNQLIMAKASRLLPSVYNT